MWRILMNINFLFFSFCLGPDAAHIPGYQLPSLCNWVLTLSKVGLSESEDGEKGKRRVFMCACVCEPDQG